MSIPFDDSDAALNTFVSNYITDIHQLFGSLIYCISVPVVLYSITI